jgi:hypothetical protein
MEPIKSLDEKIIHLSIQCKEAVYSNVDHRAMLREIAKKLDKMAKDIQLEHHIGMLESSFEG